jgi:hypothetical protein
LFDVDTDTIPQNTMPPVNAVIDPLRSGPGAGLPSAATGQRYLILEDIGNPENTVPGTDWGDLVAKANDIIEFNGSVWIVTFEAGVHFNNIQYITNITTSLQYRWTGQDWVKSYEGLYPGGEWSLVL